MAWLRQDTGGQAWLSSPAPGPRLRQMPEPLLRQYPSKLQQLLLAASESTTSLEPKHVFLYFSGVFLNVDLNRKDLILTIDDLWTRKTSDFGKN